MLRKAKIISKTFSLILVLLLATVVSLTAAEIYNQPFTSDLGDMDTVSVVGSQTWYWQDYDNGCATMTGFEGGAQYENEDWLITPELSFSGYSAVTLNFREAINYEGGSVNDNEEIFISTDYTGTGDPNTANWTELTVTGRSGGNSWTFVDVDPVDLSTYDDEASVYIAYKYTSSDTNAGTWEIGEVVVTGTSSQMPEIANVTQTPESEITSSTTVSVSAEVTDPDGEITLVELHWGTESGNLSNTIDMSNTTGDNYETDSDIPAQPDETTVYYEVYAEDDDSPANTVTSSEFSYTVNDPSTTTLPYSETFDDDLGDCYTYSVSGDTKEWYWYSGDQAASCNGYNSGDLETDWLILPGINLDDYENEIFVFDTWYNYGSDDPDNYLKVFYSTDYAGIGDPSTATWDSLAFTRPASSQTWTSSGEIDLSGISGTGVWIGFKYNYNPGNYRLWEVDNISISSGPVLSVNPTELSGFSYFLGNGPSSEQIFTVQGSNLTEDVSITAPTNYEISRTSGSGFGSSISLTPTGGSISATDIYVRLKAGLSIGNYNDEDITVSSSGITQTVTCNGSVYEAMDELMLSEIADPADNYQARFVEIYNGSGETIDFDSETWYLCKQANGSSWSDMQLTGSLSDEGVFVIASSQTVFEDTYGFSPDMSNGSVINGNG
ncbi:MAG: choice-of-anchor J domain-containing protein, partial [Candidatus Cloacimonetes bacterium]|nr:choice-of-anchor J domain-containing protein [Candidatus Cloacimonadota bacterium]